MTHFGTQLLAFGVLTTGVAAVMAWAEVVRWDSIVIPPCLAAAGAGILIWGLA